MEQPFSLRKEESPEYEARSYEEMLEELRGLAPSIVRAAQLVNHMYNRLRHVDCLTHRQAKKKMLADIEVLTERSFYRYLESNVNAPHRKKEKKSQKLLPVVIESKEKVPTPATATPEKDSTSMYQRSLSSVEDKEKIEGQLDLVLKSAKDKLSSGANLAGIIDELGRDLKCIASKGLEERDGAIRALLLHLKSNSAISQFEKSISAAIIECLEVQLQYANLVTRVLRSQIETMEVKRKTELRSRRLVAQ